MPVYVPLKDMRGLRQFGLTCAFALGLFDLIAVIIGGGGFVTISLMTWGEPLSGVAFFSGAAAILLFAALLIVVAHKAWSAKAKEGTPTASGTVPDKNETVDGAGTAPSRMIHVRAASLSCALFAAGAAGMALGAVTDDAPALTCFAISGGFAAAGFFALAFQYHLVTNCDACLSTKRTQQFALIAIAVAVDALALLGLYSFGFPLLMIAVFWAAPFAASLLLAGLGAFSKSTSPHPTRTEPLRLSMTVLGAAVCALIFGFTFLVPGLSDSPEPSDFITRAEIVGMLGGGAILTALCYALPHSIWQRFLHGFMPVCLVLLVVNCVFPFGSKASVSLFGLVTGVSFALFVSLLADELLAFSTPDEKLPQANLTQDGTKIPTFARNFALVVLLCMGGALLGVMAGLTLGDWANASIPVVAVLVSFAILFQRQDKEAAPDQSPRPAADAPAACTPAAAATAAAAPAADAITQACQRLAEEGRLTTREAEVLELLARGRSPRYIADQLVVTYETARAHTKHLYTKLGVHTREELFALIDDQCKHPSKHE